MAALVFPVNPVVGDVYPLDPGLSGVTQYRWDGTKWNSVPPYVSLGSANQDAYNDYEWPVSDGTAGHQLTTDGAGNLTWDVPTTATFAFLGLLEQFNGVDTAFTLVEYGTAIPFFPSPTTNLVVFLGGVPQIPVAAYTVVGNTITFAQAPEFGSTVYAISVIST